MNSNIRTDYELHDVTDFEHVEDYKLRIKFDDGSEQLIDFEPVLYGPLFGALRDPRVFKQVKLEPGIGTLVWPNGADVDPTVLYNWPDHVDAIIKRRQERYAVSAGED
jgi:hypothetical protein